MLHFLSSRTAQCDHVSAGEGGDGQTAGLCQNRSFCRAASFQRETRVHARRTAFLFGSVIKTQYDHVIKTFVGSKTATRKSVTSNGFFLMEVIVFHFEEIPHRST